MEQNNIRDYVYRDFQYPLERTQETHPHIVRREPNTTYVDEFASRELREINPVLYTRFIEGWSRSYYSKERHMEAIIAFGLPDIPFTSLNTTVYEEACNDVQNRFCSLPRVRAFDVLTELDQVPFKQSTSAGYDYGGAKGEIGGVNHKRAIHRAKAIMWNVRDDGTAGLSHAIQTFVPDVGYTRTQLADLYEKTKVRNVWGRAFHYILLEGLFAAPLIKMFSQQNTFYHIGQDPIESVPKVLNEAASKCKWLYALDWKQFDATVSRFEIEAAFQLLESILDFPNHETFLTFYICKQLFIHKKIAAPDGRIYWSHKGIPSGSYFTSIIGSIINRIRVGYLWRTITGHEPIVCYTQGDDSLCGDNILIKPEEFSEVAEAIGWTFNTEKTEYSTLPSGVSFLGRTMVGGLNQREIVKCLRLLVYPEYPVTSGRISSYRAESIDNDSGHLCEDITKVGRRLERQFGTASEEEVPSHFKRYIM